MKSRCQRHVTCPSLGLASTSIHSIRLEHLDPDMHTMIIRSNRLYAAPRGASILPPDFLVPASFSRIPIRPLSSTSRCRSRIGGAPLSLPAEVNLRILDIPAQRNKGITRTEQPRTVEVEGPLGTPDQAFQWMHSLTLSIE